MAESVPRLPEDDIEAAAQQSVQDENAPANRDKSSRINRFEGKTYEQHLYDFVKSRGNYPLRPSCLDFSDLSKMNIVHLMNELAKYDQAMMKDKAAPQDIEHVGDLLHRYTTAVQDLGFWSRLPKHGTLFGGILYNDLRSKFPAIYGNREDLKAAHLGEERISTSGSIDPLRSFLKRVLPREFTWTNGEHKRRPGEYFVRKIPEEISPFVDTLARFIVAITGGLSLVIPMLVMRLGETLPKSLTTVSVAVILFSALTSLMFKASNVETLAATAAYAAVLVVFVGTSS